STPAVASRVELDSRRKGGIQLRCARGPGRGCCGACAARASGAAVHARPGKRCCGLQALREADLYEDLREGGWPDDVVTANVKAESTLSDGEMRNDASNWTFYE